MSGVSSCEEADHRGASARPRRLGDGAGELTVVLGESAQDQASLVAEPLHKRRRGDPHLRRHGRQGELGRPLAEHHPQGPGKHRFVADPPVARHLDLIYK